MKTPWTASDYNPLIRMDGARKLADSGVAPLVAAARGYHTIQDEATAKKLANTAAMATGHMAAGRRLARMVAEGEEDLLVIPWFSAARVYELETAANSSTTQFRPSRPEVDVTTGKVRKYEFLAKQGTTIDLHPSTPSEWVDSSLRVLITEGALKGDSGLTAQLLANGVTAEQLAMPSDPRSARLKLHELMNGIPTDKRVAIISIGGVGIWRDHSDWHSIKLTNREVFVAFDGDHTSNYNVWKQANDVFTFIADTKRGTPRLINFSSLEAETQKLVADIDPATKLGLDDYLTKVGDWNGALRLVEDALPAAPERSGVRTEVGTWRVDPKDETVVEAFAAETAFDGSKGAPRWIPQYNIGGRILTTESFRRPTHAEIYSGVFDEGLNAEMDEATCAFEVSISEPTAADPEAVRRYRITGPAIIMGKVPSEWDRHGANIPPDVLRHPEWPPRKGAEWLTAVKANRADEIVVSNAWDTMGWVPADSDGHPTFIVGTQVLGKTQSDEARTVAGVKESTLGGSSGFGVHDTYWDMPLDEWKKQTLSDIEAVLGGYIESGFWRNRLVGTAAVATMLRPTLPLHVNTTVYLYGPPRAGKSYTAAFIMAGWQSLPGKWTNQHLPGSAEDTAAATEFAIARTPIWVADDFAPSVDRRQAESNEAGLSRIIRSVHNETVRRRNGTDGKQRKVDLPIALLVVTAENEMQVDSIRERIIALNVPKGALGSEEAISSLSNLAQHPEQPISRLTAAMIRFWTFDSEYGYSWPERIKSLKNELEVMRTTARDVLESSEGIASGEAARHASMAADLAITFQVLRHLAEYCGMPDDHPLIDKLVAVEGSYMFDLFTLAAQTVKKQRETTPGRSLVGALAKLMSSGRAHVTNPTHPGAPPAGKIEGDDDGSMANFINSSLGWVMDLSREAWVPKGINIGAYGVNKAGERIALFDATNAFREAQKQYSNIILPGTNQSVSWASVWDEGLTVGQRTTSRPNATTLPVSLRSEAVVMSGTIPRVSGVPVALKALIDPNDDTDTLGSFASEQD